MKVDQPKEHLLMELGTLDQGEVFKWDNILYMKGPTSEVGIYACISIMGGRLDRFSKLAMVSHYPDASIQLGTPRMGKPKK